MIRFLEILETVRLRRNGKTEATWSDNHSTEDSIARLCGRLSSEIGALVRIAYAEQFSERIGETVAAIREKTNVPLQISRKVSSLIPRR